MELSSRNQQYQTVAVTTLTPGEQIVLLYDELALCINKALLNLKTGKVDAVHHNLIKSENIVLYFIDILDLNYPIADGLLRLYRYLYQRLVSANVSKDENVLKEILPLVNQLKITWRQVEINNRQQRIGGRTNAQ